MEVMDINEINFTTARWLLRVELHVSFPAIGKRAHVHAELMNVITGRTLKLRYRRDAHTG